MFRKLALGAFAFLVLSLSAHGQALFRVQKAAGAATPTFTRVQAAWGIAIGSGTTVQVTLGAAPTAGNAVVCFPQGFPDTLTVSSISDGTNAYTVTPNSPSATNLQSLAISAAYLINVPAGAGATITATLSGSITFSSNIWCGEFHRSSGTWAFDTDAAGTGASGGAVNTPSITPAAAGGLLIAVVDAGAGGPTSANSPWTQDATGVDASRRLVEYILSAPSGATAANFTVAGTNGWNSMAVALK